MHHALRFAPFVCLLVAISQPYAAGKRHAEPDRTPTIARPLGATDNPAAAAHLAAQVPSDTTWLYSAGFNGSISCLTQGWTSVDLTAQTGDYWHVDDYAGVTFGPLAGTKSLWCGARSMPEIAACSYQTFPGYGNRWDQRWCTASCLSTSGAGTANLDVSFLLRLDTEASYDGMSLEYTADCTGATGWIEVPHGLQTWSGAKSLTANVSYPVSGNPVRVRLRFTSDGSWSDEDGLYPSNGAAHVDNLKVEALAIETFEDETVGATSSNDWLSCNGVGPEAGFGNYAGLVKGALVAQEDPCIDNISCMWAFIQGSTSYYNCGGFPTQPVVPYINESNDAISNEVRSPAIALTGTGSQLNLQFDVYRDLTQDALVYYLWRVRTISAGCPSPWSASGLFYGDEKEWFKQVEDISSYVNLAGGATHVQVALGVVDMCPLWCGSVGTGLCHSHAPLFDNVKVYRVNTPGPHWSVRDIDLFQDTFATNGTLTGVARADAALDTRSATSPTYAPGDSAVVFALADPSYAGAVTNSSGLSDDPNLSTFIGRHKTKKQVYMWVAVWPQGQPNKSGDGLSDGPGGQANRYPHIAARDYVDSRGVTWTAIRADYTYIGTAGTAGLGTGTQPIVNNRFNVDLNDNLFTPGDTICFFYGATSPGGTRYYSDQWHVTDNIAEVAANPMEFTVLPAGGFKGGGDILYVDGADGYGSQPYFDGALMVLRLNTKVDRYDVRGPASGLGNTLAGRLYSIAGQLNAAYKGILWDSGSLPVTLGDGTSRKSNDYQVLDTFLDNLTGAQGGVYLSGDDMAENLMSSGATSAITFRSTYMPFTLASGDHIAAGMSVSPKIVHWPLRVFSDDFTVFGGCPEMNDFDVLNTLGSSRVEMSYGSAQSPNGAVLSNQTVVGPSNKVVMLSGFSFAQIRDDELDGISDRAAFLREVIRYTVSILPQVTGADPALRNSLAQNYPNPFNPATTIAFSIKQRGRVQLDVFDVSGRRVRSLADEARAPGAYEIQWDGRDENGSAVASGVYFYKLVAGDFTSTKKMVLLK